MTEKRKYMRFNIFVDAICRVKGLLKKIKVNNFGREGVGIMGNELVFKEGENVEVELMIPGDNIPIVFEGEVAWVGKPAYDSSTYRGGVKFKKMTNTDRSRILEYIYRKWIMPGRREP